MEQEGREREDIELSRYKSEKMKTKLGYGFATSVEVMDTTLLYSVTKGLRHGVVNPIDDEDLKIPHIIYLSTIRQPVITTIGNGVFVACHHLGIPGS